ncbi:MAG: hypothetical protein QW228_05545 [Candidatus Aenigmatarchaeota archaeon]
MGASYIEIITTVINLWKPKTPIKAETKNFSFINYPYWLKVGIIKEYYEFYKMLSDLSIPFISVKGSGGIWLINYKNRHRSFSVYDESTLLYPRYYSIDNYELVYNYSVFGGTWQDNKVTYSLGGVEGPKLHGADYVITLYEIEYNRLYALPLFARFAIELKGFSLKGVYLVHENFDSEKLLTFSFLRKLIKLINQVIELEEKFSVSRLKITQARHIFYSRYGTKDKIEVLDTLEKDFFAPIFEALGKKDYIPQLGYENTEKRIKDIEKAIKSLGQP